MDTSSHLIQVKQICNERVLDHIFDSFYRSRFISTVWISHLGYICYSEYGSQVLVSPFLFILQPDSDRCT
jgi:hypothetical protein